MNMNNLQRKSLAKREKLIKPSNQKNINTNQRLPKEEMNIITNANSNMTHWNVNRKQIIHQMFF